MRKIVPILVFFLFIFSSNILFSQPILERVKKMELPDLQIIQNPKPTIFKDKLKYVELHKINSIQESLENKIFLVKPEGIVVNSNLDIFIFDAFDSKIKKYNNSLEVVKAFGGKGQGPGEFNRKYLDLYLSQDDVVYTFDDVIRRITGFTSDGEIKTDLKIVSEEKILTICKPIIDSNNNIYLLGGDKSLIHKYNSQGTFEKCILKSKEFLTYRLYSNAHKILIFTYFSSPNSSNINHEILNNGDHLIYLPFSGLMLHLKEDKLMNKYFIWPDNLLIDYQKEIKEIEKELKEDPNIVHHPKLLENLLIDRSESGFFYLSDYNSVDEKSLIYKFDITGQAVETYFINWNEDLSVIEIKYIRDGIFYTIGWDNNNEQKVTLYKE